MSFLKTFENKYKPLTVPPVCQLNENSRLLKLDLSAANPDFQRTDISTTEQLGTYIFERMEAAGAEAAIGGYGENRTIYQRSEVFKTAAAHRNIHLGIDIWMAAGTEVCACLPGRIHSFADNDSFGDYGPTIILEHQVGNGRFYTLYGHLSKNSLPGLERGQIISGGEKIGHLGTPSENVGWPPHLHFQVIRDLQNFEGDYPGVCSSEDREFFLHNCPDPEKVLKLNFGVLI